jgi:hypothetical protein
MKKQTFVGFLLFWFLLYPAHSTFAISGNDWNGFTKDAQDFYVVGFIDAVRGALASRHELPKWDCAYTKFEARPVVCFSNSPYKQMIAIVRKYMNDSPAQWHNTMSSNI